MFSGEINDRKERMKVEKYFKTNVLVPELAVIRKEEGATAAASHLPSLQRAASFVVCRAGRAVNRD